MRGSIDSILDEADLDKDGRISLPEFQKLLRQASMEIEHNKKDHLRR